MPTFKLVQVSRIPTSYNSFQRWSLRFLTLALLVIGIGYLNSKAKAQPRPPSNFSPIATSEPQPTATPTPEPNVAPVARSWSYSTRVDTAVETPLGASDANDDTLTYTIITPPAHGTLSGTAPDLIYTPAAKYSGSDTFDFKVNDGELDSALGIITIDVTPTETNIPLGVDALIRSGNNGEFIGNGIFNKTGTGQTLEQVFKTNASINYEVKLQNEDEGARPLRVKAPSSRKGWTLRYFDAAKAGQEITLAMTGENGWVTPSITGGESLTIRVELTPSLLAAPELEVPITLSDAEDVAADTVKVQGQFIEPYRPDATIEITEAPVWESYDLGDDLYLPLGDNPKLSLDNPYFEAQTNRLSIGAGGTAIYRVYAQNDGDSPDQLRVKAPSGSNGWVVRYFNEYGNDEDITSAVTGAGWMTPKLNATEDWGIRVEVTPRDDAAFSTWFPVEIQVDSVGAGFLPELRDVVTAITQREHLTNDLVIYPTGTNGSATAKGMGTGVFNLSGQNQTLARNTYVLKPVSFLIGSQVSHVGALYRYNAPAGDANWSIRYFYGDKEITAQISGAGWEHEVTEAAVQGAAPQAANVSVYDPIRIEVTPLTLAENAVEKAIPIRTTAVHEAASVDVVRAVVHREAVLDVSITPDYTNEYLGVGIYNSDGKDQTAGYSQYKGADVTAAFNIRIANHGMIADTYTVKAPALNTGWSVRFFNAVHDGDDITAEITSSKGWTSAKLKPGIITEIRLEATPDPLIKGDGTGASLVTATAVSNASLTDSVKAIFGSQRIKKLQYSLDQGTTWLDAPDAESGNAISGQAKQVIGLRAIPLDPALPWPFLPELKPYWDDAGYWNVGAEIWVQCGAAGQERLISAECGNTLKTKLKVMESYRLSLKGSKTYVALNGGKEGQVALTTKVTKSNGQPAVGMTIRFTAKFEEGGANAGEIGNAGTSDDQAVTDANGIATVILYTGAKEGYVDLQSFLVEGGRDTFTSRKQAVVFGLPTSEAAEPGLEE